MAATKRAQFLLQLYHHAVLPRDVPGHDDGNISSIDSEILDRLIRAVQGIAPYLPDADKGPVDAVRLALTTAKTLNVDGQIDKRTLVNELQDLRGDNVLILYITEQNAALLVYRLPSDSGDDEIVFEVFETSAASEKVLASENALLWDFPGQAVAVPFQVFANESFRDNLAGFLQQGSLESVKRFSAIAYKAGAPLPEIRDTTSPTLISGLLMAILEANGRIHNPTRLTKRVRDTVSFDNAHKPWRRSPFYLVLRVSMQRHLYRMFGPGTGRLYYKTIQCLLLSHFLDDSHRLLPHEASHLLRQKLSSRLAKLEVDKGRILGSKDEHNYLFRQLGKAFDQSLSTVAQYLEREWAEHKRRTMRPILPLPQRAMDTDLKLHLPVSGPYLDRVLNQELLSSVVDHPSPAELLGEWETSSAHGNPFAAVYEKYVTVSRYEEEVVIPALCNVGSLENHPDLCIHLAETIITYVSNAANCYDDYPVLKSKMMLNLMELWVAMDKLAVASYGILQDYHPGFEGNSLDVLHLVALEDMRRLETVQSYVSRRRNQWSGSGSKTVFDSPADDCFAVRYYNSSQSMQGLRSVIDAEADKARVKKEKEWEQKRDRHQKYMTQVAELDCETVEELNENGITVRTHKKGCKKHRAKWKARTIKIGILEHPLPSFEPAAKAAVFEVACPRSFAAYRDATWILLETFAYANEEPLENIPLIRKYHGLRKYVHHGHIPIITLGSSTKSFLDSHYAETGFPVGELKDICRPCGLQLHYYDCHSNTWATREAQPSFAHHFPLKLPPDSAYASLQQSVMDWPSSNEILASQTKCPGDLNVHEYMAGQSLLVGTHSRWLSLLRELGSTNLNFSTDSTWALVSRLVHQVGPASNRDPLRDVHAVFHDVAFCRKLLEQVRLRLGAVRGNWREPIQMDILISILIKVRICSPYAEIQDLSCSLLRVARDITWTWQSTLRLSGSGQACGPLSFATWASLLCKRTFYALLNTGQEDDMDSMRYFFASSIHLQNSLVGNFYTLPHNLRNAVLQDLFSAYSIRIHVRDAIATNRTVLLRAVNEVWPVPRGGSTELDLGSGDGWMYVTLKPNHNPETYIFYHVILGTLLINGQPLGLLPLEYRALPVIQKLFGTQQLSCFPSGSEGMSWVFDRAMPYDHWIHAGFREGNLVIRAEHKGALLEFIPNEIFNNSNLYDLPSTLLTDCYHWLNLQTGVIEVRQGDRWKSRPSNWCVDIRNRCATRRNSILVDPYSDVCKRASLNFRFFEFPHHITVYQPVKGLLRVELKRLELDFFVNKRGMLHCRQLNAVIVKSQYQDSGTWYGLCSQMVIQSTLNPSQRSILVPCGLHYFKRYGQQVQVYIRNDGDYLRFPINDTLGRIECAAEPRLLYTKASLHAYTSHFLPDRLTGRTGVEEALYHLGTGSYQPWGAMAPQLEDLLRKIAVLSPRRTYYPPGSGLRCMETVLWNEHLTSHIQDDRYRGVIGTIFKKLADLTLFGSASGPKSGVTLPAGDEHLELRALSRTFAPCAAEDDVYRSRDTALITTERKNVFELSKVLSQWDLEFSTVPELLTLLQNFAVIGGYARKYDTTQLTDLLSVDLSIEWGALGQTCLQSNIQDRYHLMFLFTPIAFRLDTNMDMIRVLIAHAIYDGVKALPAPASPSYLGFKPAETPDVMRLAQIMADAKVSIGAGLQPVQTRLNISVDEAIHQNEADRMCTEFAGSILLQWPAKELDRSRLIEVDPTSFQADKALELISPEWMRLAQNFEFSEYLKSLQLILIRENDGDKDATRSAEQCMKVPYMSSSVKQYPMRLRGGEIPTLADLLQKNISPLKLGSHALSGRCSSSHISGSVDALAQGPDACSELKARGPPPHIVELSKLVAEMKRSSSAVRVRYSSEMEQSIKALTQHIATPKAVPDPFNPTELSKQLWDAKQSMNWILCQIKSSLQREEPRAKWLQHSGLWPKITPMTLLSALSSTSGIDYGREVKEALVSLGLLVTEYQHSLRIQDASYKKRYQQLVEERSNLGHQNWDPSEDVDWLLLEIEGNVLLRPEQVEVARATISPASGKNSVLQLLMGKGKTSCILPMVALALANQENLVRVVVPRPLLLQSAQVLQSKIGGLLNREILHIPFSRKTTPGHATLDAYLRLHKELQKRSGIMLSLPEHILSFKLSGLQRLCNNNVKEASAMIKAQRWLDLHARDILDECDVSLSVRTQLIYPSGSQMTVDGHPLRWQTIEAVLHLVRSYLPQLRHRFPQSIEVIERATGGYPLMYFLRQDAENHLIEEVIAKICSGQTCIIPCSDYTMQEKTDLRVFISSPKVDNPIVRRVGEKFRGKGHLMKVVYLLRGIFVHRILLSTLKKRWNVQFGLHPGRDPIAVPYLAKGVPSPASEWGHPDVSIILTCLSFYYEGLSVAQFKQAFEQLLKSNEPSVEYQEWVTQGLPESLRDYHAINVEDGVQLSELHHHVRYSVPLLDFYLNSLVFPKHAKQFTTKLQASGWDLVQYDPMQGGRCQTTGFSGTNDSRHQLPMTIKQNDLPGLSHTNAEVLSYLLETRNRRYVRMIDGLGRRLSEDGLLELLSKSPDRWNAHERIRVLIDAGAQLLFDANHRAQVIWGKGKEMPLSASPFAENLEGCLVYLDESHCRGTDLKLPPDARAAVTLGPQLTKDALVQAAMRLRLLGQSQCITFFSPPEVHQSIIDLRGPKKPGLPNSSDVIRWLLTQTCDSIEQLEPLYFTQGNNYLQRLQSRLNYPNILHETADRERYISVVRSTELQTLKQLYAPKHLQRGTDWKPSMFAKQLQGYVTELQNRKAEFHDTGLVVLSSVFDEVEQEREIEYEVEVLQEVQKRVHFAALGISKLHRDIRTFATTGRLPKASDAYQPMPSALQMTAVAMKHGAINAARMASNLFISTQFSRTVKLKELNDTFLRPCQWILWGSRFEEALVVCPEEADRLIPILRRSPSSGCHLIVYAAPVTRRMLPFNDLNYCAVPPLPTDFKAPSWLKIQLGIFAGRLYFGWDEYHPMLEYLGVGNTTGFNEEQFWAQEKFTSKPLAFLHDWLAMRRKGQDFEHTPMGFVTTGTPLTSDHPFFLTTNWGGEGGGKVAATASAGLKSQDVDSDDDDDDQDDDLFYDAEEDVEEGGPHEHNGTNFEDVDHAFFDTDAYVEGGPSEE